MGKTSNVRHQKPDIPSLVYDKRNTTGEKVVESKGVDYTAQDCIDEIQKLAESFPETNITRDFFRKNSTLPESVYTGFFGTFPEFLRAAELQHSRSANKIRNQVARHAAVDHIRRISEKRLDLNETYIRKDKKRFQTMIACSDLHDQECDPFYLRVLIDTIKNVNPEIVCLDGDIFDVPEFGRFNVDPRDWDVVGRVQSGLKIIEDIREAAGDKTQIDFIEGNHECVSEDTEILTDNGWVIAKDITEKHIVASYNIDNDIIEYGLPDKVTRIENSPLVSVSGDLCDELVSDTHRIMVNGELLPVKNFINKKIVQTMMTNCTKSGSAEGQADINFLKLLLWTIMDGTLVTRQVANRRIQFKLSKPRKIERLKSLLDEMNTEYTFRAATKSGGNKLQPYYICIYGDNARLIWDALDGKKEIPAQWEHLSKIEINAIIEEILHTDGTQHYNHINWRSTDKKSADIIQLACIKNGLPCRVKVAGKSGYTNSGKVQYLISIFNNGLFDRRYVSIQENGIGNVIAIQTSNDTLVTRRNGKVSITGNSRVIKHLLEADPGLRALLSGLHEFDLRKLFGLDRYEVNYIANCDLFTFTDAQQRKEVSKNFKLYWGCVLAHHFPHGRNYGTPGFNGHHHKHLTYSEHNVNFGSYEWHQMGGGHKREASYCDGSKWNNGFLVIMVDTQTKSVVFDYSSIGDTFAISAGKVYGREPNEFYPALTKELDMRVQNR